VPEAIADTVPRLPDLQSQIAAVNTTTADRSVVPVLKAGPSPGTVDLELKVDDTLPLHAVVEINDQHTADTTDLRAQIGLSYDNLWGRQDSLGLQYQFSPQDTREVNVFAASYTARLGGTAGQVDKLTFTYIDSSSDIATLGDINVAGKGRTYSARLQHPVAFTADLQTSLSIGADFKKSAQDVKLSGTDPLQTPVDYSSLNAGVSVVSRESGRVWSFGGTLAIGLSGLGSSTDDFANKCFHCRPNWSAVRLEAGLRQELPWNLDLDFSAAGQYAADPLISNEQMLIGGAHSIRGYLEAEELGDFGARGSAELRAGRLMPQWRGLKLAPFLFFDAGLVRLQEPLPGQPRGSTLLSTGVGLDAAWSAVSLSVFLAEALRDGTRTRSGDERVGFLLRGAW
jgi:hemolysin activation/secretion protein